MPEGSPAVVLSPPDADAPRHSAAPRSRSTLEPKEYANAVRGYSSLRTGAGQDHVDLGKFLTASGPVSLVIDPAANPPKESFVTLYELGTPSPDGHRHEQGKDKLRGKTATHFHSPKQLFNFARLATNERQSQILFIRGWQTQDWLNHIGAKYLIDPEFYVRHLDFRPVDDNSHNFSVPALPSSSWHLISLPVISIYVKNAAKGMFKQADIEKIREDGAHALSEHQHRILSWSGGRVSEGDSMIRDFYVFDEKHAAIEQRISICVQREGEAFNAFIWLDSGREITSDPKTPDPWNIGRPLPVIRHKPMVALKCHLFPSASQDSDNAEESQPQSASLLYKDYGRSLHRNLMSSDALYALNEIFSFAASSEMQFLNLIDAKLDKFNSPKVNEIDSLPNLKYAKELLYRHIQKIEQVIESMKNPKWPKTTGESGKKARTAAEGVEQDFNQLLHTANKLHKRCTESITVLMSSISIAESSKQIDQAQRLEKLTFLAFIFVPLSFTTSFFGMNVHELTDGKPSLYWWAVSIVLTGIFTTASYFYPFGISRRLFARS